MKDKGSLREYYQKLLKEQDNKELLRKSFLIADKLWEMPSYQQTRNILFFASMPGEVDTLLMIEKAIFSGKRVGLPIVEKSQRKLIPTLISSMEDLHKGTYGINEPYLNPGKAVALQDLDMVLVPGLAFDRNGHRLGRGAGYYDRFLSGLPKSVKTVGLAFDFQLTDSLPVEPHDMRVDTIITG